MITVFKCVHIKAVAKAYVHVLLQYGGRAGEVCGRCDLQISLIALGDRNVKTSGARNFDIIVSAAFMGAVCGQNGGHGEALRCLRAK